MLACCCYQDTSHSGVVVHVPSHSAQTHYPDEGEFKVETPEGPAEPSKTAQEAAPVEAPPPAAPEPTPVEVLEPPSAAPIVPRPEEPARVPDSFSFEEEARTFNVRIPERKEGAPLGVDIDTSNQATLVVLKVKDGLIKAWNADNPKLELKHGDTILSVGGVQGNAEEMLKQLKSTDEIDLRIRRGFTFAVAIDKSKYEERKLGLNVTNSQHVSLLVKGVNEEGIFAAWNRQNPSKEVRSQDRIIEVDGTSDNPGALLQVLMTKDQFEMIVCRAS